MGLIKSVGTIPAEEEEEGEGGTKEVEEEDPDLTPLEVDEDEDLLDDDSLSFFELVILALKASRPFRALSKASEVEVTTAPEEDEPLLLLLLLLLLEEEEEDLRSLSRW